MQRDAESLRRDVTMYHSADHLLDIEPETYNYPAFVGDLCLDCWGSRHPGLRSSSILRSACTDAAVEIRCVHPVPM